MPKGKRIKRALPHNLLPTRQTRRPMTIYRRKADIEKQ